MPIFRESDAFIGLRLRNSQNSIVTQEEKNSKESMIAVWNNWGLVIYLDSKLHIQCSWNGEVTFSPRNMYV